MCLHVLQPENLCILYVQHVEKLLHRTGFLLRLEALDIFLLLLLLRCASCQHPRPYRNQVLSSLRMQPLDRYQSVYHILQLPMRFLQADPLMV